MVLDPWIYQSVCLQSYNCLTLKLSKLWLMYLTFYVRVVNFFALLKRTNIYKNYLCLLPEKMFPPSLPNLGSQIRCVQNQYTTVQTDLKYSSFSRRDCGLIVSFQIYGSAAGRFESNLFWEGQYDPPPKLSYWKKN